MDSKFKLMAKIFDLSIGHYKQEKIDTDIHITFNTLKNERSLIDKLQKHTQDMIFKFKNMG